MTELLYLDDAYLREFDATVVAVESGAVALDRTAFYPGGGGQPADTGRLNAARVTRVFKDEHGMVWHQVEDLATTKEIGPIRVTKTESKGRANKRVKIELG